jgi:hypothetical protein
MSGARKLQSEYCGRWSSARRSRHAELRGWGAGCGGDGGGARDAAMWRSWPGMVVEGGEEVVWVTGRVVEQSYREGGFTPFDCIDHNTCHAHLF